MTFDIDADASKDEIAAVVAQSQKRSAVFDMIPTPASWRVPPNDDPSRPHGGRTE